MSLDVGLYYEVEPNKKSYVFEANITHNLGKMADKAGIYYHLWRPELCDIKIHNDKDKRLYRIWKNMKARGSGKSNQKCYSNISIDQSWNSYIIFRRWALLNGYNDTLTIDRINTNDNYFPENCRWVNYTIQAVNKSKMSTNTSGYIGVSWRANRNKWIAKLTIDGKRKIIGSFNDKIEAAKAYDDFIINNNLYHSLNFKINNLVKQEINYKSIRLACDIIPYLEKGLQDMKNRREYYEQFNSPNGWGTYEHFVPFVEKYLNACKEYPNAKIHISR